MYIWPKCFFRFSLSMRHLNMSANSKRWIAVITVISGLTCKRGERVNFALCWPVRLVCMPLETKEYLTAGATVITAIPVLFAIKSSFKFPALATPNEVDRAMIDWWRMMSPREYLEALYFSFACLIAALLGRLSFVCFLSRKTPFHYWNNS